MYRTELDGLRAVAILSVIINHFGKAALPNGYVGVDIFYVISGYVITQSLVSREHASFKSFILDFYTRRIKRLVPALFLCVALTLVAVALVTTPASSVFISSVHTGITALFGLSNMYLLRESTDYFGTLAEINPFTHTWSLGVEEQFYFLFPFLLWFTGIAQKGTRESRFFFILICVLAIASLTSYLVVNHNDPTVAFYLMPLRFWEIAAGTIVFLALPRLQSRLESNSGITRYISPVAFLGLILVLILPHALHQPVAIVASVFLTALLIFGIRKSSFAYRVLTARVMVFIGVISYSLYLYHWSVLTISRLTIGVEYITMPAQLSAVLLLSLMSYQFVEQPLRRSRWSVLRVGRLRVHEIGYAFLVAFAITAFVLYVGAPMQKRGNLYLGGGPFLIKEGASSLTDRDSYFGYTWEGEPCVLVSNDDVHKVIDPSKCTFGNFSTARRHFLVIGNSFSVAELEMYKILVEEKRGSVTITSALGATPVPELKYKNRWDKASKHYWESVVPGLVRRLSPGDVILMVNDGASFSPRKPDAQSTKKLETLKTGLERIASEMSKRGILVIYQSSNPFMRESGCNPDSAAPRWRAASTPCNYYTRKASLERRRAFHDMLKSLENKYRNFAVLDLFDVFCPGEFCKFLNDKGTYLYRDEYSHPSVEASILSQPVLLKTVDRLIRKSGS